MMKGIVIRPPFGLPVEEPASISFSTIAHFRPYASADAIREDNRERYFKYKLNRLVLVDSVHLIGYGLFKLSSGRPIVFLYC